MSSDAEAVGDPRDDATERSDLAAQVELFAEENRRLRAQYVRARRATHRRTAFGLFGVGVLAALGALALPGSRDVLLALAGIGLFGGVLTYYLIPEQFVSATVSERVYAAFAAIGEELVAELGLSDRRVYAPARTDAEAFAPVRLFVPQRADYAVPEPEQLDSLFVVTDDERERGVAVTPSGGALYREFERSMVESVAAQPSTLAAQLTDGLVDGFEVVSDATFDADRSRIEVEIEGSAYGALDRFDNPVASFLGVGLAAGLGAPVATTVAAGDGATDYRVTCEWDPDDRASEAVE